jgi:hypothetical protein
MAGFNPAIRGLLLEGRKTWMPATSAGMTRFDQRKRATNFAAIRATRISDSHFKQPRHRILAAPVSPSFAVVPPSK